MFVICYKGALTMEKQKKKISKKAVVICSIALAAVLIAGGLFTYKYVTRERLYTFDEITQGLSKQVSYVVEEEHVLNQARLDAFYEKYGNADFKERIISEEEILYAFNAANEIIHHYVFYDVNDKILFDFYERRYTVEISCNGIDTEYSIAL